MDIAIESENVVLFHADCREALRTLADDSIDSIVTDPPYELGFMGKSWDNDGIAFDKSLWAEALRVLKPGGHLVAFGGTRTYHRMACAIEDAGFEVRDSLHWMYSQGFPKSLNIGCKCRGPAVQYNHDRDPVRGVRNGVRDVPADVASSEAPDVFAPVQRPSERTRVGSARAQGQVGVDRAKPHHVSREDARPEESRVEGRRDLQAEQGELRRPEVCPMPGGVPRDGKVGRVRDGAPSCDGDVVGSMSAADGSGASHRPRHSEQQPVEPDAVRVEPGSQDVRGACAVCGGLRDREGWGTALKPAHEPIILARKPLVGTVAKNVEAHGTGALNIAGCRASAEGNVTFSREAGERRRDEYRTGTVTGAAKPSTLGRWPPNILLSHTPECGDECAEGCAVAELDRQTADLKPRGNKGASVATSSDNVVYGKMYDRPSGAEYNRNDEGGASRFFPVFRYEAKAARSERERGCDGLPARTGAEAVDREEGSAGTQSPRAGAGRTAKSVRNHHPTVKPVALMQWLCRLVTPPGGVVLDPFTGSGTTGVAAIREGFSFVGIEKDTEHGYIEIAKARIGHALTTKAA